MALNELYPIATSSGWMKRFLDSVSRLYERTESLQTVLEEAAELAVEAMQAEKCVIAWVRDDGRTLKVRASAEGTSGPARVETNGTLTSPTNGHLPPEMLRISDEDGFQILPEPLTINGNVVGYIYAICRDGVQTFAERKQAGVLRALAKAVASALELQQLRFMLASRYASHPVGESAQGALDTTLDDRVLQAVKEPEKVARIIARSFYKDLRRAGFEPKQVLVVASEIVGSLNDALRRTEQKTR